MAVMARYGDDAMGDADFSKPPDFSLIQEMLTVVNDVSNSSLDPTNEKIVIKKNKIGRNVAIQSILDAQEIKPIVSQTPLSMFRKKKSAPAKDNISPTLIDKLTHAVEDVGQYRPSSLANEYYNKYVENSKRKEQMKEDLWTNLERQMKQIDARKNSAVDVTLSRPSSSQSSAADASPSSSRTMSSSSKYQGLDLVRLLYHRHIYLNNDAECIVCEVAAKHGYQFKEE